MRPFKFILPPFDGDGGLTVEQRNSVNCESAMFSGVPGTGKTTVAIWRILKNKDDILMTYTRLLAASIVHLSESSDKIYGVDQWYWHNCDKSSLRKDIQNNNVLNRLRENNIQLGKIIIDEGQDVDIEFYKAIKLVSKRVSVGADDAQKLYDVNINKASLLKVFPENNQRELTRNFRNLFNIYNFARQFVPENPQTKDPNMLERLKSERPNGSVEIYVNDSQNEINKIIKSIVQNQSGTNIGILLSNTSDVDKYSEILKGFNIEHSVYHSKLYFKEKRKTEENLLNILVTTFHSAKGLEFDTVVMPSFENASNDNRNQYYVGSTRAREFLFILCSSFPEILEEFDKSTYTNISQGSNEIIDDEHLPF